jgi:hypothetical protein
MSFRQRLLQVPILLLIAIRDYQMDTFNSLFLTLTNELAASVERGLVPDEDIVLMGEVAAAVEEIASSFARQDEKEAGVLASVRTSVAAKLGTFCPLCLFQVAACWIWL